jgi:hypothetical protein
VQLDCGEHFSLMSEDQIEFGNKKIPTIEGLFIISQRNLWKGSEVKVSYLANRFLAIRTNTNHSTLSTIYYRLLLFN